MGKEKNCLKFNHLGSYFRHVVLWEAESHIKAHSPHCGFKRTSQGNEYKY